MNDDDRAFERAISELLDGGSDRTSSDTFDAVLLAVRTTPQERDLRIPWRTAAMSNPMRLVAALALVAVVGVGAFSLFGPSRGIGGASSPPPTAPPSAPAPTARPQPSPSAIDASTWPSYTSKRYGFSIGHPAGWTVTPSTGAWRFPADATLHESSSATETFVSADGSIAASAWSVAVKPGTTLDSWIQTYCLVAETDSPCTALQNSTVPLIVRNDPLGSRIGSLVRFTQDTQAFVLVGDRMYVVAIWRPEDFINGGVSRLLEAFTSTMLLPRGGPGPSAATPRPS
jgi:hypothetical protein